MLLSNPVPVTGDCLFIRHEITNLNERRYDLGANPMIWGVGGGGGNPMISVRPVFHQLHIFLSHL